ncbi:MAG: hypothetical protein AAFY01_06305, partial [Pseudomonadota bacterium]
MSEVSTTVKGNTFRSQVASLLEAAGFETTEEVRADYKKVDVGAIALRRQSFDGPSTIFVETKDYSGTLSKSECISFV